MIHRRSEVGAVSGALILNIVLMLLVLLFGSVMIWALVNYFEVKNNLDAKVEEAVLVAKKEQTELNERAFAEREKNPLKNFVSPEDLGRVSFNYPKTWSTYVDKNTGGFEAYLHPNVVHPKNSQQPYALRVSIEQRSYEQVLSSYKSLVQKGDLRSSPVTLGEFSGNRLDGTFSKEVQGAMVVFKVRDKTVKLYTESVAYLSDFNTLILKDLSFNP